MSDDMKVLKDHHRQKIRRAQAAVNTNLPRKKVGPFYRTYGYRYPARIQIFKKLQEVERLAAIVYRQSGLSRDERQLLRRAATLLDDVSR